MHSRRDFTRRIIAAIASAAIWSVSSNRGAVVRGTESQAFEEDQVAHTGTQQVDFSQMDSYPSSTYLPPGYRLFAHYTDRREGFLGGVDEFATFYKNPSSSVAYNRPLCVFVARESERNHLAALQDRSGTPVGLTLSDGNAITAQYHDGWWALRDEQDELYWDNSDVHSLIFSVGEFRIGVRGSRVAGVNETELAKVAASLA